MRIVYLWIPLFFGLVVYFSLSILESNQKIRNLQEYKESLASNNQLLEHWGEELELRYFQLQEDENQIILEAYRIGLVFPDDRRIQLQNREPLVQSFSPGDRVYLQNKEENSSELYRNIAITVTLLVFFLELAVIHRLRRTAS